MQFTAAQPTHWPPVAALLAAAQLPLEGASEHLLNFTVALDAGGVVRGAAGFERYGEYGLLRSVVVAEEARGAGLGGELVARVLDAMRREGMTAALLLTTTAEPFFARRGFQRIERAAAPAPVQASVEFRSACPASAAVMTLSL